MAAWGRRAGRGGAELERTPSLRLGRVGLDRLVCRRGWEEVGGLVGAGLLLLAAHQASVECDIQPAEKKKQLHAKSTANNGEAKRTFCPPKKGHI